MHSTSDARSLLSAPATYRDLLHTLLISRGRNPAEVGRPGTAPPPRRASTTVNAVGGSWTPAVQQMGEAFHSANFNRLWASETGSAPEALAWAMDPNA